jgi:phosphoribosyl-ATP pyrophosphohydrolase/phosphoribosyl-AMP cyclohydrolase
MTASAEADIFERLEALIAQRQRERPTGSYTTYLFESGQDKILKKLGEELTELVIASKNGSATELVAEASDLLFHLLVLLAHHHISFATVQAELAHRHHSGAVADQAPKEQGPG